MRTVSKVISILLCMIMVITLFAASGCTQKEPPKAVQGVLENKKAKPAAAVTEKVTNVYKTDYMDVPDEMTLSGDLVMIHNDRIYTAYAKILNTKTFRQNYFLCSVDMNGENFESKQLDITTANGYGNVPCMAMGDDGTLVIVSSVFNMETSIQTYQMDKLDSEGKPVFSLDLSALALESDILADRFYPSSVVCDSSGNIYLHTSSGVIVLDANGKKLFEVIPDSGYVIGVSIKADTVFVSHYDVQNNTIVKPIDFDGQKLGPTLSVPGGTIGGYNSNIFFGDGYDYYIKNSSGIYGFNEGDSERTMLLDWINSDINGGSLFNDIIAVNADTFMYIANKVMTPEGYYQNKIAVLTRVPDSEIQAKYLIRLVVLERSSLINSELGSAIIAFNKESKTHRVYIDDYSRYNESGIYDPITLRHHKFCLLRLLQE